MGEQAGIWVRVSSGGQDEANQLPDVVGHCTGHDYEIARRYVLHDKSASKGEHEPALAEMLADMAAGKITVLVAWQSSRLDRQGTKRGYAILAAVEMAGGRIEIVKEPEFGGDSISDEVLTTMRMVRSRDESREKSERVLASFATIDAAGAWRGKPPWGFVTTGEKRGKRLVPTAQAREYVPQIFAQVIGGRSLEQIARWLEREGVRPMGIANEDSERGKSGLWYPRVLSKMIRNSAYMGHAVVNVATQQTHVCEALVDPYTWKLAGQALDTRPKRGPVLAGNRCALSGAVKCWKCGGPLYRIASGTGAGRTYYLRCSGTGAARKSCGAPMIRLDVAEALADEVLGGLRHPVYEFQVVPGNEAQIDARLAELDFERRQVALRGLSWADEDRERARIRAEYELAAAAERIPTRRIPVDTGVTYGQRWHKLDTSGRADWLRSGEIAVYLVKGEADRAEGTRDGVSLVLVWPEDDEAAA